MTTRKEPRSLERSNRRQARAIVRDLIKDQKGSGGKSSGGKKGK